jgi:hypothetical protein
VNGQLHIQGYLQFYHHAPHSATMIKLFSHFLSSSIRIKNERVMWRPRLSVAYYLRLHRTSDFHEISRVS